MATNKSDQYRPATSERKPNNKVPNKAPSGNKLEINEAWGELIGLPSGDSLDWSNWSDGDAQPIEIPTLNAKMLAVTYFLELINHQSHIFW